ncbi:hypothetical protein E2C01_048936 [Portunus trituberculatus]|uniref:Uncharacterized protein n=1 Tax=Portunus trituberculatus TaxID=210409 RepID=A0A5B7GCC2_PORTR|nr:hypothetical protein [Portunus trituberculatus]
MRALESEESPSARVRILFMIEPSSPDAGTPVTQGVKHAPRRPSFLAPTRESETPAGVAPLLPPTPVSSPMQALEDEGAEQGRLTAPPEVEPLADPAAKPPEAPPDDDPLTAATQMLAQARAE